MRARNRAFTLIEVLIVIAIIAIIAAILFPVLANSRRSAEASSCSNNLRQIGFAAFAYAGDNDERYPFIFFGGNDWLEKMKLTKKDNFGMEHSILKCPSFEVPVGGLPGTSGYAYNGCTQEKAPPNPSKTVMVAEVAIYHSALRPAVPITADFLYVPDFFLGEKHQWMLDPNTQYAPEGVWGSLRHLGMGNYVFFDGSAKRLAPLAFRIPEGPRPCTSKPPGWQGPRDGYVFDPTGVED